MAGEAEELTRRLARAGWSVTHLRDGALRVRDEVMDVTRGAATRGLLRGHFVRVGPGVDGALAERIERLGPLVAEQHVGAAMFRAEVLDAARAREELVRLEPLFEARTFEAAVALVASRGFTVDPTASLEDTYDTFVWEIRARRAGEHLYASVRFGRHGLAERAGIFVNDFGQAELRRPAAVLTVAVLSLARAEELLAVLIHG
ncbi:MAG: hypothetical protein K0S65_5812 [Labilithrix sp.]|nr:hypothetical protein [Labilithrix sp.]